jgi:hypothetical protein
MARSNMVPPPPIARLDLGVGYRAGCQLMRALVHGFLAAKEEMAMKIRVGVGFAGWPTEVAKAICGIRQAAEEFQREVPEDHYGTIVPFHIGHDDISAQIEALVRRGNPRVSFESYGAWPTPDAVLRCIDAYVAVGVTKFVFRPLISGAAINDQFARLAQVVVPRYHT